MTDPTGPNANDRPAGGRAIVTTTVIVLVRDGVSRDPGGPCKLSVDLDEDALAGAFLGRLDHGLFLTGGHDGEALGPTRDPIGSASVNRCYSTSMKMHSPGHSSADSMVASS